MNSDQPPAGLPSASPTPASPRSSNLKGRWKRGPNPVTGAVSTPRPATPANFGLVTDVTSAKESLSGEHVRGYEGPVAPSISAAPMTASAPAPVREPATPHTESFTPQPSAGSTTLTPRPGTFNPSSRHSPPASRAPSAEYLALREAQRAEAATARPVQPAKPPQPSRPPQDNRGNQPDNRGNEREHFVALKPDPANDPAPRRLRTEATRPVPVQEYSPSNFGRVPDKSIPAKSDRPVDKDRHSHKDRHSDKRESSSSSSSERPKPHDTIPARVPSSKEGKSGGVLGFLKNLFSASKPARTEEKKSSAREDDHERDDDEGEGQERRRHSDGQGRRGEHRHGSHRRSSRR